MRTHDRQCQFINDALQKKRKAENLGNEKRGYVTARMNLIPYFF